MPNLRNTRTFREELLAALGVTDDHDVENENNFKSALLDALNVDHIPQDVSNFEKFREKLIEAADGIGSGGGGGDSDFSTVNVTFIGGTADDDKAAIISCIDVSKDIIEYFSGEMQIGETSTFSLVLYKGKQILGLGVESIESYTGSITIDQVEEQVIVTGDAEITVYTRNPI